MTDLPPPVPRRRSRWGCGGKGMGCLAFAGFFFFVLPAARKAWNERANRRQAEATLAEKRGREESARENVRSFAERHAPELLRAQGELDGMEAQSAARVAELEGILQELGRTPNADPDFQQWSEALRNIRQAQSSLREDLHEAYLAYRKFELSPDPESEKAYQDILRRGRDSAAQTRGRYERLRENL
jgi:hypothetical protein